MYIGEFCSLPPMTLNPRPSSVLGSSTTLGWACPSLAANAATVACKFFQLTVIVKCVLCKRNMDSVRKIVIYNRFLFPTLAVAEALISGFP